MAPPAVRRRRSGGADAAAEAPASILAGRAWVRGKLQPVEIAIGADGRILSVGRVRTGAPRRDVGDAVILPAATDLHVHFRDPGGPEDAESIPTGTVGAAVGGVALVGEMPNTRPAVTNVDALLEKVARVHGRAAIDMVLYASPSGPGGLAALARAAGAFKLYLSPTTGIERPVERTELTDLLRRLEACRLPVSVHAEDPTRFASGPKPDDPAAWDRTRPDVAEESAIASLSDAPRALRLHVAHVTTPRSARRAREMGLSFEVTPQHLLLSDRSGSDARFKVNPPLRSEADRAALWEAFRRGEVPMAASDHAPHPLADKSLPFDRAPSGVPGVETMLPLLLARVRSGTLELDTLLRAVCDRPARWLGQPIGRIAPGHRAHLLVVDFRVRRSVSGRLLHSPSGWTPFEGQEAIFPREHYRDGTRIVADGEYVGVPNGRTVRPEFALGEPLGSPTSDP
jgi:dihydroorotase